MKKIARAIIFVGLTMSFAACSWQMPEKVSVKSNAEYNFSLGNFEKSLDEELNLQTLMGEAGNANQDVKIFDYFPGKKDKKTQHVLVQVKVCELDVSAALSDALTANVGQDYATYINAIPSDSVDLSTFNQYSTPVVSAIPTDSVGLDFNPSTLLSGMKDVMGAEFAGKVNFNAPAPLYLFCETPGELKAQGTLKMFYGSKTTPIVKRTGSEITILEPASATSYNLQNKPLPTLEKEGETVITDFEQASSLARVDVKELLNATTSETTSNIQEDDQLCIDYNITGLNFGGTVSKANIQNGIYITIYAVIDIPFEFKLLDDISLDLKSITKASGASTDTSVDLGSAAAGSSETQEFEKYLKIIDSLSVKYIAYKLPFKSTPGMQLGVVLADNEKPIYARIVEKEKTKNVSASDKTTITLTYTTVKRIRETGKLNPNLTLFVGKDSVLCLPREKAIDMNLEVSLKTDGTVQVK